MEFIKSKSLCISWGARVGARDDKKPQTLWVKQ